MNIFEQASRESLRFNSARGELTVEQLWTLPLTSTKGLSLNSIAQELYKSLNQNDVPDFVGTSPKTSKQLQDQLRFDIVTHIINVRKKEEEQRKAQNETEAKIRALKELIAAKQTEAQANLSITELEEQLKLLQSQTNQN